MPLIVERVLLLRQVELFANADDDTLAGLAGQMDTVALRDGDELIRAGDLGRELYIVIDGTVSVRKEGREVELAGPRRVVGELAALDPAPRTASVVAVGPVNLLRLEHMALLEELQLNPDLAVGLIRYLARRLRSTVYETPADRRGDDPP